MRRKAALTGLLLFVSAGAAIAQSAAFGPNDRPPEQPPAMPSRPNPGVDNEVKERSRLESEARDRKRESRLKRVMGSVCGRC